MWLGSKITSLSDHLFRLLFRHLFRYDIFISYARRDGKQYALKLRDQLKHLDYSCFLDLDELPAGNSLSKSLKRALKKSATFVIVGTEFAIQSRYVELELTEFTTTGRAIIPISVEETLSQTPWPILRERDIVWIDETQAAVNKGVPSPTVADSIDKLFKYTRRNSRVRAQILSTIVLFVVVVSLSIFLIQRQVNAATRAAAEAERQKIEAIKQKKTADDATEKAKIAEADARTETLKAVAADKAAREATTEAKKQERIALANAKLAQEQQRIAEDRTNYLKAQQMGVQADIDIDRSPDLERSMLLSVESLQRALTPDASIAWARGMEILPRAQEVKFSGRDNGVTAISYSPDGRFFAEGIKDGTVIFFRRDQKVAAVTRQLDAAYPIKEITFGKDWVGASNAEAFKIWDLNTFKEIRSSKTIENFNAHARVAFSPDGRYIATWDSTFGFRLRVIDTIKSTTVIDTVLKNLEYSLSLAFSPNGKWLAIASHYSPDDETGRVEPRTWATTQGKLTFLKVANFEKGAEIATTQVDSLILDEKIDYVIFGPMGNHLATESQEGGISIWKIAENDEHIELTRLRWKANAMGEGTAARRGCLMFSPDESYLATTPDDGTARIWEISSGREVARIFNPEIIEDHFAPPVLVAFSPDGQFATSRSKASFWKTEFGGDARRLYYEDKTSDADLQAMAISPGGKWLAATNRNGIQVFNTRDWSHLTILKNASDTELMTFSNDDRWLIAAGSRGVTVIETGSWTSRFLPAVSSGAQTSGLDREGFETASILGFSPDHHWLVRAYDNSVRVFEVGTWKERSITTSSAVVKLTFSPDSRRIAVWVAKRRNRHIPPQDEIFLWETATLSPVTCVEDEPFEPAKVQGQPADFFRKDICSKTQAVQRSGLSDVHKWKEPLEFNRISNVSPDGHWSAGRKSFNEPGLELRFNEGMANRLITTLMQAGFPRQWTFTPDSRWLIAAEEKIIKLWPLYPSDMIDSACARLGRRELTNDEWHFSDKKLRPCSLNQP